MAYCQDNAAIQLDLPDHEYSGGTVTLFYWAHVAHLLESRNTIVQYLF